MKFRYRNLLLLIPVLLFGIVFFLRARRPKNVPGIGAPATLIAFSPDGKTLVCASANDYVQMYLPEMKKWRSFYGMAPASYGSFSGTVSVARLRFSADGKTLFAGGNSGLSGMHYSFAWEVPSRKNQYVFHESWNPTFDVTRDGKKAVVGVNSGILLVDLQTKQARSPKEKGSFGYRPPNYQVFKTQTVRVSTPYSATFSPDGKTLAVSTTPWRWDRAFWDAATLKPLFSGASVGSGAPPNRLEWSPDGVRIAAIWFDKIAIWNIQTHSLLEAPLPSTSVAKTPLATASLMPPALAWSPDGKWLFSGGDEVRQWDTQNLQMTRHFGVSGPVAVSPDGKTLATANGARQGEPHGVWLWKLN